MHCPLREGEGGEREREREREGESERALGNKQMLYLSKGGHPTDVNNLRPVSLLSDSPHDSPHEDSPHEIGKMSRKMKF